MDEKMCLVYSGTTNSILREIKYFQTLTKNKGNVLTIVGRDAVIVGSGRATIMLPMGTSITIEDALLYPDSTRTLLGSILKPIMKIMRSSFSLQRTTVMAKIHLKEFPHSRLNCTIHI
jgi:hypothetical protein